MKAITIILCAFCHCYCTAQNRYTVIIDELMIDPSPQVALPASEWIELKNNTADAVNLQGWRIADATSVSGPMPAFVLQPDSFVIVCSSSAVAAMSTFGAVISVSSFPSLDNDEDVIAIRSPAGNTIHAVPYNTSWYKNDIKKEGGWTLEMIDTKFPCLGSNNWKASDDMRGGTPGGLNSVHAINTNESVPQLKYAYTTDSITAILVFSEAIDTIRQINISCRQLIILPPLFNTVQLKLNTALQRDSIYGVSIKNISWCAGNSDDEQRVPLGLPGKVQPNDIIINEILFNPRSPGTDYVEIYNRSHKIIDLSALYLSNRNSFVQIYPTAFYSFPGEYVVITENAARLQQDYFVKDPNAVVEIKNMPSFPDDKGNVVLQNLQNTTIDEVDYDEKWHFKLLTNKEGISLERIDADAASQNAGNWHSAAADAGYGTPGYRNSQAFQPPLTDFMIEIVPKVFSPDNDGHDDFAVVQYHVAAPGYAANVQVFDAAGRHVRYLVKNAVMGENGYWTWDGLGENGNSLPVGLYIIYTEIFNLQGKKLRFKNTVVLTRRF